MSIRLILAGLVIGLLTGCGSSTVPASSSTEGDSSSSSSSSSGGSSPIGGTTPTSSIVFEDGCNWFPPFTTQNDNFAFPDTNATYWLAVGPTNPTPDMELVVSGQYADARYFSLQVYDGSAALQDHVADFQIAADGGSSNTFDSQTVRSGAAPGGHYTAYVNFGNAPATPAANTLYRGQAGALDGNVKKRTYLMLRVYVPGPGEPLDGGFGLPTLTLHSNAGDVPLAQSPDAANCQALYNAFVTYAESHNQTLAVDPPVSPPDFKAYNSVFGGGLLPGAFVNADNAYLAASTTLLDGEIQLVRGLAPTFTDQRGSPPTPQLRYWSICQNDFRMQNVIACVDDASAVLDSQGYYNVAISATQPTNATVANGFNWMPFGDQQNTAVIILRNLLPDPAFSEAVQNAPPLASPQTTMGSYYPQATYCSTAVFEGAAGQTPAQVFATCQASRLVP